MGERNDNSPQLFLVICCWLVGGLGLLVVSLTAWALKDCLGPSALESQGREAHTRFWREVSCHLFPWAALFAGGCALYWRDVHRFRS